MEMTPDLHLSAQQKRALDSIRRESGLEDSREGFFRWLEERHGISEEQASAMTSEQAARLFRDREL